jgi:hypothetical protein
MIFVRLYKDTEEVVEKIGCSYYYREISIIEEKEARLRD